MRPEDELDAKSAPDPIPTVGEFVGEAVDLGRMTGSWWLAGVERMVIGGLATPARAASSLLSDFAGDRFRSVPLPTGRNHRPLEIQGGGDRLPSLRERGAELLRRSADVREVDDPHPAYRRILEELAPDEARLLRLLVRDGPQPVVDVRTGIPPVTRLVEPDLTLVAVDAGCRSPGRVRPYLDNLRRLGLVSVSSESVGDPMRYQLLEAQPEVAGALEAAGRTARTARRSVELTSFGHDFCLNCLPIDGLEVKNTHPPAAAGG